MFGSVITIAFWSFFGGAVAYGLACDLLRWRRERERSRSEAQEDFDLQLAELRERYEQPADPLEGLWNLPARTPDHEAIP